MRVSFRAEDGEGYDSISSGKTSIVFVGEETGKGPHRRGCEDGRKFSALPSPEK
jgi:hypothetical protein